MKRAALFGPLGLLALAAASPALAADTPATGGLKPPKQIVFVDATYPPDAAAAGLEADVVLNLTVGADGHISHAAVATSAGPGREAFDAAAIAAAAGYLFKPAESDGKPVAVELEYKVKFRFHAKAPAPPLPSAAPRAPAPPAAAKAPPRESPDRTAS